MLKLKSIREKNPKGFCKWEADTCSNEYVVIRYKNYNLDVRVSSSHDDFVLGKSRCIYRQKLNMKCANYIDLKEVIEILELDVSLIDWF